MVFRIATPEGVLSSEATVRLMELAKQPYRPPEILKLKEEIEVSIRIAELKASAGPVDPKEIARIVNMKLELDRLYGLWAEGKL